MKKLNLAATITVEWGYDSHSITLTPRNWAAIKAGRAHSQRGAGYHYEGEFFWDYWSFAGGLDGELEVGYGGDGGQGFVGKLSDATIEEHEYQPKGLFHAITSSIMWTYELKGFARRGNRMALFLFGSEEVGHRSWPENFGSIDASDPLRAVCYQLLANPTVQIQGSPSTESCSIALAPFPLEPFHHEFLASCWFRHDGVSIGQYLINLTYDDMRKVYAAQGSLLSTALHRLAHLVADVLDSGESLEGHLDLVGESQIPITESECIRVSQKLVALAVEKAKAERKHEQQRHLKTFGPDALCCDPVKLVQVYGKKVPAGYLVHALQLSPDLRLAMGDELLALLESWRRAFQGNGQSDALPVLQWLVGDRQKVLMDWLSCNPNREAALLLSTLRKRGCEAKADLQRGFGGGGWAGGLWMARRKYIANFASE